MLTPSVFSYSFSFVVVVQFSIEPGRDAAITTEGEEVNNWTMVWAILWYRSGKKWMRKMEAESLTDLVSMAARLRIPRAMSANLAPNK
jgi:hypothetical protein